MPLLGQSRRHFKESLPGSLSELILVSMAILLNGDLILFPVPLLSVSLWADLRLVDLHHIIEKGVFTILLRWQFAILPVTHILHGVV